MGKKKEAAEKTETKEAKPAEKSVGDAPRTKMKKEITFKLSDKEMGALAKKMAAKDNEIIKLEEEFTKIKSDWKMKIDARETERRKLSKVADAGEERRMVDCEEERDYAGNAIRYYVNGELKEERLMTADERQQNLPLKAGVAKFKEAAEARKDPKSEGEEIANAIREETNKKSKHSATDGPRA